MRKLLARAKTMFAERRAAWPWLDHLVRAAVRYHGDGGNRLAASISYYGFLSLLPLLLLAISVLGFVLHGDPGRSQEILGALTSRLPGVGETLAESLSAVTENRGVTGLVGVAGLVWAGTGGVDALRESVRLIWHQDPTPLNLVKAKLRDLVTMAGLGAMFLVSWAVTALGSGAASWLLESVGVTGSATTVVVSVLSLLLALLTDVGIFLFLFTRFTRLGERSLPWWAVLRGSLFGAIGLGLLKYVAALYVSNTTAKSTALYGALGAVIGVLVGLNLVARFVLLTAAWTATTAVVRAVAPDIAETRRPPGPLAQSAPRPLAAQRADGGTHPTPARRSPMRLRRSAG